MSLNRTEKIEKNPTHTTFKMHGLEKEFLN
jgi:hypothetical protein